nr:hypothetical protein Iba_chr15dCG8230 [Ipomoea batatas]
MSLQPSIIKLPSHPPVEILRSSSMASKHQATTLKLRRWIAAVGIVETTMVSSGSSFHGDCCLQAASVEGEHRFEPNFPAKANNNIVLPELDGPKSSVILQKKILDSETVTFLQANECEQIKLSKAHRKNYCRSEGRTAVADCSQRSSKPKVFTAAAGADTVEARLTFVANPREEERRRNDGDW